MKKSRILLTLIFLTPLISCVNTGTFYSIPKTATDFHLTPSELTTKYSDIRDFHPEHRNLAVPTPTFEDIPSEWGEPIQKKREWLDFGATYSMLLGLGAIAAQGFDPVVTGIILGTGLILAPRPPETYTWKNGNYEVDATFSTRSFGSTKYLGYWKWKSTELTSSLTPTDWLAARDRSQYFYRFGYSTGGDTIARYDDGEKAYGISRNTMIAMGYKYHIPDLSLNLKLSGGIEYSGINFLANGPHLIQYPLEIVADYNINTLPINLGIGFGYMYSPVVREGLENGEDLHLNNALSFITQIEYKKFSSGGFGFQYEFIDFKRRDGGYINGDNISIYLSRYF